MYCGRSAMTFEKLKSERLLFPKAATPRAKTLQLWKYKLVHVADEFFIQKGPILIEIFD